VQDHFAVGLAKLTAFFCGNSGPQGIWLDDGMFRDHCASRDDRAFPDAGIVENDCADADETCVFDDAAVDGGVVADGDPISDDHRVLIALAVEDGAVLNVGVRAYADRIDVAAKDGVHPDAGVFAELDVADKLCGVIDIAACRDGRIVALPSANHGSF